MMRIHSLARIAALIIVLIVSRPASAGAQVHDVRAAVQYQLLHIPGTTFPAGVNAEVSALVRTPVALLADAGWARKHMETAGVSATARIVNFAAGIRLIAAQARVRPFVQTVAGGLNTGGRATVGGVSGSASTTRFQIEPGAGVLAELSPALAVTGSVHLRRVFLDEATFETSGENEVRALVGISVRILK